MRFMPHTLAIAALALVAGCQDYNDSERAVVGAAVGGAAAIITDGNLLTGAAVGAAAGALCDDAGVCD